VGDYWVFSGESHDRQGSRHHRQATGCD
jgi:hypothetical protein